MITLYNTGMMHAVEEDGFGVYWFSEPNFDAESVARRMLPIFHYEKNYFGDGDAQFRVFLRRDPFVNSNGGSACPYAFISGYSAYGGADPERWFNTLLHEMTHTWPSMTDFNVGEGTWFSEGGTEYYCTILPYKGGFVDAQFTVDRLNERSATDILIIFTAIFPMKRLQKFNGRTGVHKLCPMVAGSCTWPIWKRSSSVLERAVSMNLSESTASCVR